MAPPKRLEKFDTTIHREFERNLLELMLGRYHTLKAVARALNVSYATIKARMADIRRHPATKNAEREVVAAACERELARADRAMNGASFDGAVQLIQRTLARATSRAVGQLVPGLKRAAEQEVVTDVARDLLEKRARVPRVVAARRRRRG